MSRSADVVTVERFVAAPPEAIFELIAHPDRHQEIDGSGTVREAKGEGRGEKVSMGSTGGTLVRESWDISEESPATKLAVKGLADKTEKNMAETLERIEEIVST